MAVAWVLHPVQSYALVSLRDSLECFRLSAMLALRCARLLFAVDAAYAFMAYQRPALYSWW